MVNRRVLDPQLFVGGTSHGSITFAEQMPYLHALLYHWNSGGKEQIKAGGPVTVHIVTDSQVTADNGNQASDPSQPIPAAGGPLWAAWRDLNARGYLCHFHWRGRSQSVLNWIADLVASHGRLAAKMANTAPTADQVDFIRRTQRQAASFAANTELAEFAKLPQAQQAQFLQSVSTALYAALVAVCPPAEAPAARIDAVDPLRTSGGPSVPLRAFLPDHKPSG